jgi:hypothetical protein
MEGEMPYMKFIKSNYNHAELHFPPTQTAPGVILPRASYLPHEIANGKRNVIVISDQQYARLNDDEQFKSMLKAGLYEFVSELPAGSKTSQEVIEEQNARIAELEAQLVADDKNGGKGAPKSHDGGKGAPKSDESTVAMTIVEGFLLEREGAPNSDEADAPDEDEKE